MFIDFQFQSGVPGAKWKFKLARNNDWGAWDLWWEFGPFFLVVIINEK